MRYCPECDTHLQAIDVFCTKCGIRLEQNENLVDVSPDGRVLLTSSKDKTLKIWDVKTGSCIRNLKGHRNAIISATGISCVKYAVSGGHSTIRVWDLETGQCSRVIEEQNTVIEALAVSQDVKLAVCATNDGNLKIWSLETGECMHTIEDVNGPIVAIKITKDNKVAVAGSRDMILTFCDLEGGDCIQTLTGRDSCHILEMGLEEQIESAALDVMDRIQLNRLFELADRPLGKE